MVATHDATEALPNWVPCYLMVVVTHSWLLYDNWARGGGGTDDDREAVQHLRAALRAAAGLLKHQWLSLGDVATAGNDGSSAGNLVTSVDDATFRGRLASLHSSVATTGTALEAVAAERWPDDLPAAVGGDRESVEIVAESTYLASSNNSLPTVPRHDKFRPFLWFFF